MARDFRVTCDDCGYAGPIYVVERHDCAHESNVTEFGGRCEDFPCCGHGEEGCSLRAEDTKEHWAMIAEQRERMGFDPDDPMFDDF